jgi:hypothetical protein
MKYRHTTAAVALGFCLGCTAAQAQFGGTRNTAAGASASSGRTTGNSFVSPAARLNQFADRLLGLRLQLQLEAQQNTLWNEFQHRAMEWASEYLRGPYASTDEPALRAIEQRLSDARKRQGLIEALLGASRELDQSFNPEQHRVWDQQLAALLP